MMHLPHKEHADGSLAKPVASSATRARRRPFLRALGNWRTVSSPVWSLVWSSNLVLQQKL